MVRARKQYLGDSVYVEFDGFHLVLTTENGLPGYPSNTIYLEPGLLRYLVRYAEQTLAQHPDPAPTEEDG